MKKRQFASCAEMFCCLSILAVCAVGLFLLTRAVAAREGAIESRVAATWYQDGVRKFHAGAIDGAIESFRKVHRD